MRGRLMLIGILICSAGSGAAGQSGTADGVVALARGDYQRAADILKPIAEDWRTADSVAQFFMAGLYETGQGVPADPLRACALYLRAASNQNQTFGREAEAVFMRYSARGREFFDRCQRLASTRFDNGFEPATFDLGPGHFVEWTLPAVTVTYDGKSRRDDGPGAFAVMAGSRFLPPRHTELNTGPMRSLTRHFVDEFVWLPKAKGGSWTLHWMIFEVIRDQIIRIDTPESIVTVAGDDAPSPETFDVRGMAELRVDEQGNAEWAVLKGDRPETRRIESDAERREVREQAMAREAALKGVDWSRRPDVDRLPAVTYSDADGCGLLQVYGWTADRTEAIVVNIMGRQNDRSTPPAAFDLARESADISVEIFVYDAPQHHFEFCSDVRMPRGPDSREPGKWRAVAGTITIELSPPGVRAHSPHLRRATITLTNVVLRSPDGKTVRMPRPVRLTAIVGGFFG